MSSKAQKAVLSSSLPQRLRLTAIVVAWHCSDDDGQAWMKKSTLARECGLTERNVYRHLEELLGMGVLVRSLRAGIRAMPQYAFNFEALAALTAADHGATAMAAASGSDLDQGPRAGTVALAAPSIEHGGTVNRAWRQRQTEIDERKPKASLSSKAAPVSAKPDTHAAVRTPPTARSSTVTSTPAPQKTKQPPTGEQPKATRQPSIYPWLDDEQALSRRGVELGLQPLPDALAAGMKLTAYMVEAIKRAGKAGERQVRLA